MLNIEKISKYIINESLSGNITRSTSIELIKELLSTKNQRKDIAVIGMALKFPQANSKEEFWDNIAKGKNCINKFPEKRKKDTEELLDESLKSDKGEFQYAPGAYLDEIDKFDYHFH